MNLASSPLRRAALLLCLALLAACGKPETPATVPLPATESAPSAPAQQGEGRPGIPDDMLVKGHGYRAAEDPCRVLENNLHIQKYQQQGRTLVACPVNESAAVKEMLAMPQAGAVTTLDDHVLISMPAS